MQTNKDASSLVDNLDLVVPLRVHHLNEGVFDVVNSQELAFDSDFIPVLDAANIEALKVADSLRVTHPKRTIIGLTPRKLGPNLWIAHELNLYTLLPVRAASAPVTLPVEAIRWRTQVYEFIAEYLAN